MTSRRAVIILVTALLLGGGILASPQISPIHIAAATTDTIVLAGAIAGWNSSTTNPNPTITVTQGDVVNLVLSSSDGALHRWFVDVDKNGATPDCPGADVCSNAFSSPTPMTFTFTVNFAPGTYTYYCSVHPTTMLGQFVVKAPPSPPGSISLVGVIAAWNSSSSHPNPTITVTQGDTVNLLLSSGDGAIHKWFLDVDKNGPTPDCPSPDVCSNFFSSPTPMTFTFIANFPPGTYTYYCSVHPTTMLGQFVVNPNTSVGGKTVPSNNLGLIMSYLAIAGSLAILATVATYAWRVKLQSR